MVLDLFIVYVMIPRFRIPLRRNLEQGADDSYIQAKIYVVETSTGDERISFLVLEQRNPF